MLESQDAVTVSCEANEEVIGGDDDKSDGIFVKARDIFSVGKRRKTCRSLESSSVTIKFSQSVAYGLLQHNLYE